MNGGNVFFLFFVINGMGIEEDAFNIFFIGYNREVIKFKGVPAHDKIVGFQNF